MKELKLKKIKIVTGGAGCDCYRGPTSSELAGGRVDVINAACKLWSRDTETKSECRRQCCEITGGRGFNYGYSKDNMC